MYEEALSESNYKVLLQFEKAQYNTNRNRLRKVIWFNSSFTQNVKTNIGKVVKQHFPKHYILKKIVNKNTFKLSYCSMKNMSSIIKQHNVKILSTVSNEKRSCNFKNEECCPLKWYCLKGAWYLKLNVKQIIILNYVLVHAKENINPVFITTRNHSETMVMKRSFQGTFGNWRRNSKIKKLKSIYVCVTL